MSKSGWGVSVSFFVGVGVQFAPVPDSWRLAITIAAGIGLLVSIVGYMLTRKASVKPTQNIEVVAPKQSGNIVATGRDYHHTEYHGVQSTSDVDEANPRLVALDDLKQLLREGDKMLQDFYLGNWERHTSENVEQYDTRVRSCAKRRALDISGPEWGRFDEPWDIDETILRASALCDAKLLPNLIVNPTPEGIFSKLYGRVERLRELLTTLTGFKIESPYISNGPASYTPKRGAVEIGPQVVPPKESEDARDKRLRQITLPRSGESMIHTVESLLQEINRHLEKYSPLLEHFAESHSLPEHAPSVPPVLNVDDDLIRNCVAVESQTGGTAFRALAQHVLGLKEAVSTFNNARNARHKETLLRWTKQIIPEALALAKVEWTTRPS
jgi:hypothetical protein